MVSPTVRSSVPKRTSIEALRRALQVASLGFLLAAGQVTAAGDEHHHTNHAGVLVARLTEHGGDGAGEEGGAIGFVYERRLAPRWSFAVSLEKEAFSDRTRRQSVVYAGAVYNMTDRWVLFGGPGLEGRKLGEREHALLRFGTGYHIPIGGSFVLAPEITSDFIEGGSQVYAAGVVLLWGF